MCDRLTSELASTEQLQESYQQLSDEVGELLTKNALAEDVAQQLSKFNAEIIGNRNPAQRIMYLERIRNDLAESRYVCAFSSMSSSLNTDHRVPETGTTHS